MSTVGSEFVERIFTEIERQQGEGEGRLVQGFSISDVWGVYFVTANRSEDDWSIKVTWFGRVLGYWPLDEQSNVVAVAEEIVAVLRNSSSPS